MDLCETLNRYPELVQFDFEGTSKTEIIKSLVALLDSNELLLDPEAFERDVFQRESECSTGIGMGIAIPHAKSSGVKEACFTVIKLAEGVDWDSLDEQPAHMVIMLAVPENQNGEFLKLLSTLSYNLMDDDFREGLFNATSKEEIMDVFGGLKPIVF